MPVTVKPIDTLERSEHVSEAGVRGRSRRGQEGRQSGVVDVRGRCDRWCIKYSECAGWDGDEYIVERDGRFRGPKAARPLRQGAWPDLVSAAFYPDCESGVLRTHPPWGRRLTKITAFLPN